MKFKEENKLLKDLVLTLYAYIPHCCYNCAYYEKTIDDNWCYNHDRETKRTNGCSHFELQNGLYIKIKSLGIEV